MFIYPLFNWMLNQSSACSYYDSAPIYPFEFPTGWQRNRQLHICFYLMWLQQAVLYLPHSFSLPLIKAYTVYLPLSSTKRYTHMRLCIFAYRRLHILCYANVRTFYTTLCEAARASLCFTTELLSARVIDCVCACAWLRIICNQPVHLASSFFSMTHFMVHSRSDAFIKCIFQ